MLMRVRFSFRTPTLLVQLLVAFRVFSFMPRLGNSSVTSAFGGRSFEAKIAHVTFQWRFDEGKLLHRTHDVGFLDQHF